LYAHGFRFSFTPLFGVLFTFPSRYYFAIGLRRVFSLTGWCRLFHTGRLQPHATQDTDQDTSNVKYGTITLYGPAFQPCSSIFLIPSVGPTTPHEP